MGLLRTYLGRLTIANGQTTSNALAARELSMVKGLQIVNAAAYTGTVTLQSAPREDSTTYAAVSQAGADVTLIAAKSQSIEILGGVGEVIRVVSGGAEGAQRDIDVWAMLNVSD